MYIDLLIITILLVCAGVGAYRGFFKEAMSAIFFISAVVFSVTLNDFFVTKLLKQVLSEDLASLLAYIGVFISFMVLFYILQYFIYSVFKLKEPSILGKITGCLFGLSKGYIICSLLYLFIYSFNSILHPEIDSKTGGEHLNELAPSCLSESYTYSLFKYPFVILDDVIRYFTQDKKIEKHKNFNAKNTNESAGQEEILIENA